MRFPHLLSSLIFIASVSAAQAQSLLKADPANDVHHNIQNTCMNKDTDILSTHFQRDAAKMQDSVVMQMAIPVNAKLGYKEFYFWLDIDPGAKTGYQPYNPDAVAWKNFYADYRIFTSFNSDLRTGKTVQKVTLQKCSESNCAQDYGMRSTSEIQVEVKGNLVTFTWPSKLIPESLNISKMKIGYTTYYELFHCNGEDDSPQWGDNAFVIDLPQVLPPPVHAPAPE